MPIVATANITTEAQLNNAIEAADNELGNGYTFDIALANYATIDLTTALEAINVGPSTVVNIEGNGGTLDGASPTGASYDQRGLFVYSGTVNIQLLTIGNTEAIGGNATGGGGGAGLGGGLFVANDTTSGYNAGPADVTLIGVNFSGDQAIGGTSIAGVAQNRGGGGMVGAGGGVFDNVTGGGGGGGLGAGASGGRSDQYGVAGIVPDAGYGVSTENHGGLSASDNYGGGGGGGGGGDDNPTGGGGGIHIQVLAGGAGCCPDHDRRRHGCRRRCQRRQSSQAKRRCDHRDLRDIGRRRRRWLRADRGLQPGSGPALMVFQAASAVLAVAAVGPAAAAATATISSAVLVASAAAVAAAETSTEP